MKQRLVQLAALQRLSLLDLYRRKDMIVVVILFAVTLVPLAFFAPFGVSGASRQMNELALLLIWIFSIVLSMAVSNRLMPPEFESRTIYPLLAKPVSRGTILLGKYLGAVTASLSALALFYLGYALLAGFREQFWFPEVLIQAFILHASFVLLLCALSILGSLALTPSANWTLTALVTVSMLLFGSRIPAYAASQGAPMRQILQALDLFAPHFDFFDMRLRVVHHWSGISWGMCAFVVCYALVYSVLCLFIASRLFRRKAI